MGAQGIRTLDPLIRSRTALPFYSHLSSHIVSVWRSYLVIVLPSRLIIINHVLTPTIVEMNSLRTADTGPA